MRCCNSIARQKHSFITSALWRSNQPIQVRSIIAVRRFSISRATTRAIANYARLQQVDPESATAHYNEALCRLLLGDFAEGWRKYEWRWGDEQFKGAKRHFAQPLWLGESDIAGRTILLHAEQGFGDTLQFCRYAKLVAALGATVVLEVQPSLVSLLSRLDGVTRAVARGAQLPAFDCHCPLLSLPLALNTRLDSIPAEVPYIRSDPQLVRQWQDRLGERKLPRVGLYGSAARTIATIKTDHYRCLNWPRYFQKAPNL